MGWDVLCKFNKKKENDDGIWNYFLQALMMKRRR